MNDPIEVLSPKARLALSRAELLEAMGYRQTSNALDDPVIQALPPAATEPGESAIARSFLGRWWRRQPARSALEFITPGLERYAQRNPGRLVTYAAGAGVVLAVLRPWRLISLGAAVTLLFKATNIADAVSAALRAPAAEPWREPHSPSSQLVPAARRAI
ncbi:hypothetical protein [Variovorax sp. GT1P44]|uniref:hypothetical protein n=1 Tax=Variovorax sp. GT1P44 TaxID=3443742 RepID=UPI003F44AE2F